jgi:hypothetical protein
VTQEHFGGRLDMQNHPDFAALVFDARLPFWPQHNHVFFV